MEQLKRKRAAQTGNLTRIYNKEMILPLSTFNSSKSTWPTSTQRMRAYQQWHSAIEEQFVGQIDTTEEDETLSQHMDAYEEAESLTQHLINVSTAVMTPSQ